MSKAPTQSPWQDYRHTLLRPNPIPCCGVVHVGKRYRFATCAIVGRKPNNLNETMRQSSEP